MRPRLRRVAAAVLAAGLAVAACGGPGGRAMTRTALAEAGYRDVEVSFHSGGSTEVVRVDAGPGGPGPDVAAQVVWRSLPARFDQLVLALGGPPTTYGYEELHGRFGDRDPALDRRRMGDEVVHRGLQLVVLLSLGALASAAVAVVVGVRVARRTRRAASSQAEGPTSGRGTASPREEPSATFDGPGAMPS